MNEHAEKALTLLADMVFEVKEYLKKAADSQSDKDSDLYFLLRALSEFDVSTSELDNEQEIKKLIDWHEKWNY